MNAIEGVRTCWRTTAKCKKAKRVTKMGDPFLRHDISRVAFQVERDSYQIAFHRSSIV